MDPQWIIAVSAAVGLLITWSSTVAAVAIWITSKINKMKSEILKDFKEKHDENAKVVKALEVLVIRHDVMLDPEFGGGHERGHPRVRDS